MILTRIGIIDSNKIEEPSGPVGTIVNYTLGDYFDAFTSRSGIIATDAFNTNNGCYQLYYSHREIKINSGVTIGLNPHTSGSNSWTWYISVSTINDTISDFSTLSAITPLRSGGYTGGVLTESTTNVTTTIPANRYFLIGNSGGPFWRTVKSLQSSRTAQVGGLNYFTSINKVWLGNWPTGGTTQIPTQLGGTGTYTEYDGYAHVHSVRFNI
jgi:hypothetical protein